MPQEPLDGTLTQRNHAVGYLACLLGHVDMNGPVMRFGVGGGYLQRGLPNGTQGMQGQTCVDQFTAKLLFNPFAQFEN